MIGSIEEGGVIWIDLDYSRDKHGVKRLLGITFSCDVAYIC